MSWNKTQTPFTMVGSDINGNRTDSSLKPSIFGGSTPQKSFLGNTFTANGSSSFTGGANTQSSLFKTPFTFTGGANTQSSLFKTPFTGGANTQSSLFKTPFTGGANTQPSLFKTQSLSSTTKLVGVDSRDKITSTQMELITTPFEGISKEVLMTKTLGMFTAGTVGLLSKNYSEVVDNTIKLAEYLLGNTEVTEVPPTQWQLNSISPLALFNLSDKDLLEKLEVLMGKSKMCNDTAFVYIRLLQQLMVEKLETSKDIYNFVMTKAAQLNNKRLYTSIKLASMIPEHKADIATELFGDTRDIDDNIQNLVAAIHIFVTTENNPVAAMVEETAGTTLDKIHTIKLVGELCGASYGNNWFPADWTLFSYAEQIVCISQRLTDH
jgi:hypothetical protein